MCANSSYHCATGMYSFVGHDGTFFGHTYMKRCFPLPVINAFCDNFNQSYAGRLRNCSTSSCDENFCNGPAPTTPAVRTEDSTNTSERTTSQEPDTTQQGPGARAGSPSTTFRSGSLGLIMTVFALGRILEICSFS